MQPEREYEDDARQRAYEAGWHQMHDHDVRAFLECFDSGDPDQLVAAVNGAKNALVDLADNYRFGVGAE